MSAQKLIASYEQALADVEREMHEAPAVSIERLQLSRERNGLLGVMEALRDEISWVGGSDADDDSGIIKAAG